MKTRSRSASTTRSRTRAGKSTNRSHSVRASRPRTGSSSGTRTRAGGRTGGTANITIDHDEIREWVESRDGEPAVVKRTRGKGQDQEGILRIDFPGSSGEGTLEPMEWEDWFEIFDEHQLAFLYQDRTTGGKQSRFNKLVRRSDCC